MTKQTRTKKAKPAKKVNLFPPQVDLCPVQTMLFRFLATGNSSITIYRRNLLCLIMEQAAVAGPLVSIFESVRLKKVEMWGGSSTNDITPSNVALEWADTRGNSKIINDYGTINRPAHIVCKPAKGANAGMWSSMDAAYINEPLFTLTYTTSTVIDVTVNYCIANGITANDDLITRTTANATIGVFRLNLDNSNAGGNGNGASGLIPPSMMATVICTS
jgi:hypothetical protein